MKRHLEEALRSCWLERMTWYEATCHLRQPVGAGGKAHREARQDAPRMETEVTERQAHLRPDPFPAENRRALAIDLDGHSAQYGYRVVTTRTNRAGETSKK